MAAEDSKIKKTQLLPSGLLSTPLPTWALQFKTTGLLLRKTRIALILPVLSPKGTPFRSVVLNPVIW